MKHHHHFDLPADQLHHEHIEASNDHDHPYHHHHGPTDNDILNCTVDHTDDQTHPFMYYDITTPPMRLGPDDHTHTDRRPE